MLAYLVPGNKISVENVKLPSVNATMLDGWLDNVGSCIGLVRLGNKP